MNTYHVWIRNKYGDSYSVRQVEAKSFTEACQQVGDRAGAEDVVMVAEDKDVMRFRAETYFKREGADGTFYRVRDWEGDVSPKPPASKVLDEVGCPRCGRPAGELCFDTRYRDEEWDITHPHKQRIEAWVEKTGWTP